MNYLEMTLSERLKAIAVDVVVVCILAFLLPSASIYLASVLFYSNINYVILSHINLLYQYTFVLFYFIYIPYRYKASFGKQYSHLRIIDINKNKASIAELLVRAIMIQPAYFLLTPFFILQGFGVMERPQNNIINYEYLNYIGIAFLLIHLIMLLVWPNKQTLADMIAKTMVVKEGNSEIDEIGETETM